MELGEQLATDPAPKSRSSATGRGFNNSNSTWNMLRHLWAAEGVRGLFAGLVPRVIKVAPACAVMITTYEYGKLWFATRNQQQRQRQHLSSTHDHQQQQQQQQRITNTHSQQQLRDIREGLSGTRDQQQLNDNTHKQQQQQQLYNTQQQQQLVNNPRNKNLAHTAAVD